MPDPAEAPSVRWRQRALTLLLFLVASALVVLPGALGDPRVSVFDEMTHADWVSAIVDGELVRRGDTIDHELLVEWACRGWAYESGLPPCAEVAADPSAAPASTYPARGLNYNPFHPPGYYLPTAVGTVLLNLVIPDTDLVSSARVIGVVWSVLAMVGVYAVADVGAPRPLGLPVLAAGALLLSVGMVVSGRRVERSRYRPDPWGAPEWMVVTLGALVAVAASVVAVVNPDALGMPLDPLGWPAAPPVLVVALAAAALAGYLTPLPPPTGAGLVVAHDPGAAEPAAANRVATLPAANAVGESVGEVVG